MLTKIYTVSQKINQEEIMLSVLKRPFSNTNKTFNLLACLFQ